MKTLQDNYMIDGFMGIDYATAPSYFATGKAAMLADGSWDAPTVAAGIRAEIRLLPCPATEDASRIPSFVGKYDVTWYAREGTEQGRGSKMA